MVSQWKSFAVGYFDTGNMIAEESLMIPLTKVGKGGCDLTFYHMCYIFVCFIVLVGILSVSQLLSRFWREGSAQKKDIFSFRLHCGLTT